MCWFFHLFAMESSTVSASVSSSTSTLVGSSFGSFQFRERLSITSTPFCAIRAKVVEVYYFGETKFHYLTDDPPHETD